MMDTVGFTQVIGMSWRIAVLLLGGVAILLVILANARDGRSRAPGTLLVAVLAGGALFMFTMFAGPPRRSATATTSAHPVTAAAHSSDGHVTARSTETAESPIRDDHASEASSDIEIDSNSGDDNFGIVITSNGDSHTFSLGHRTQRLVPRLNRIGSRVRRLSQRLHTRLDGTLGVGGTKWVISGGAILSLMFVGYLVLSATAKGRFSWPLRVLSVITVSAIIAGLAAVCSLL